MLDVIGGELKAGDDAGDVRFVDVKDLPDLSFDHGKIINSFLERFF